MKNLRLCLTLVGCLLLPFLSHGQYIPYYAFSQNQFGTYTPISGTVLASGTSISSQRYSVPLPFGFNLEGTSYTTLTVGAKGYLSFGATDPGTGYWLMNNTTYGYCAISGFDANLAGLDATTELSYTTLGTAPYRTFVVQWKNFGFVNSTLLTANFQIRLSEGSNNVSIVYGNCSLGGASSIIGVQVGMRGMNPGTYINRSSSSSSWTGTTAGTSQSASISYQTGLNPPSGLTYTFSPPVCMAPGTASNLVLSPSYYSVSGTFTASSPAADKYLVVQTSGAPLNATPVNGTTYAVGTTLGNGVVVSNTSGASFTSGSNMAMNTGYTYTIFPYRDQNCLGGPAYQTTAPLSGTTQTLGPKKYVWNLTSGSGSFTTATNWTPARTTANGGDTLSFENGATTTVTNVPVQTTAAVLLKNNTHPAFTATAATTFTISDYLFIENGSSLDLGGSNALTLAFTYTYPAVRTAIINGSLNLGGSSVFNTAWSNTVVNGNLTVSGSALVLPSTVQSPVSLTLNSGAAYQHNRNGGALPGALYNAGSTLNITGVTSTAPTISPALELSNLTWNCPNQAANITLGTASAGLLRVNGHLSLSGSNGYSLLINSTNNQLVVGGDLNQNGGNLALSMAARLLVQGNANLTAGTLDLNNTIPAGQTFILRGDFNQLPGHVLTKTGFSTPELVFGGTAHQHVNIGGLITASTISYTLNNLAGATLTGVIPVATDATNKIQGGSWQGNGYFTYAATANLVYNTAATQTATAVEWPAANGPRKLNINQTGPEPDNRIWMPGNRTVNGDLTLTKGVLVLGSYNLTMDTLGYIWTNGTDSSRMIAADSTGQLICYLSSVYLPAGALYPIGDITGKPEGSPVSLLLNANSTARYVGLRVRDRKHPNDGSATDYLSRYWTITDNVPNSTYPYTLYCSYPTADIQGNQRFTLYGWNGTAWNRYPANSNPNSPSIYGVLNTQPYLNTAAYPLNGIDFTGRTATPAVYSWTGAVSKDFQVAGNWNPARNNPDNTDMLQFNSGNTDTVRNIPPGHIVSRLTFTNNTTTVLESATTGSSAMPFYINGDNVAGTDELRIDNGSTVYLGGTLYPLIIKFSTPPTGLAANSTVTIAGRLEAVNNGTVLDVNSVNFTNTTATVTPTGVIAASGTNTGIAYTGSTTSLLINGTYEHKYATVTGTVPTAAYNTGSKVLISGTTTATGINGMTQPFWDVEYNAPAQTSVLNIPGNLNVLGTLRVISTGTGKWRIGNSAFFTSYLNNFLQTGGSLDLASANNNACQYIITGSFIQSGGILGAGLVAGNSGLPVLNFANTSAAQTVSFYNAAPTGGITYKINNPYGINLQGTGTLTGAFNINTGGGVMVSQLLARPINTSLQLNYVGNSTVTYNANGSMTADTVVLPTTSAPQTLVIDVQDGNQVRMPGSRTFSNLTLNSGNVYVGADTLTIGTSATAWGSINLNDDASSVMLTTGALRRWYGLGNQPTSPGTGVGFYPISANGNKRWVSIYYSSFSALVSGGTIALTYADATGMTTGLSLPDQTYTIDKRTNASWTLTAGNGFAIANATLGMRITTVGLFSVNPVADIRILHGASVPGTHQAGTLSVNNVLANRIGLSLADLTNGPFYLGAGSTATTNTVFVSVKDGYWDDPTTWNTNAVPSATDPVYISQGDTVSLQNTANAARWLVINPTGALLANTGSLQVDSFITNNGGLSIGGGNVTLGAPNTRQTIQSRGLLYVSAGTLKVNGSMTVGIKFIQTGGQIKIDCSSGDALYLGDTLSLTGGSILFVDAPGNQAYALNLGYYAQGIISPSHTLIFGDPATVTTRSTNPFIVYSAVTGSPFPVGSVMVNSLPNGNSGRNVICYSDFNIGGNISIAANASFGNSHNTYLAGNLTNLGTWTAPALFFCKLVGNASTPVTSAQVVSGTGTFFNSGNLPVNQASFNQITVNNTAAAGLTFAIGDFSYLNSINFTKGVLHTNGATVTRVATGAVQNAGQATGWIDGKYRQPLLSTQNAQSLTYAIGDATYYTPVGLDCDIFGAVQAGSLTVSTTAGDHPAIATSGIAASKSVNRVYTIETGNGLSLKPRSTFLTFNWPAANKDAAADPMAFNVAAYSGNAWSSRNVSLPGNVFTQAGPMGDEIAASYQIGEPGQAPVILQQPAAQNVCNGMNASFIIAATSGLSYQWQVNTGSGWTNLSNTPPYSGVNATALLLTAPAASLSGNAYRCRVINIVDTTYSNAALLQVNLAVAPAVTISVSPGTSICAGTAVTYTATGTNTGTSPVYQWMVNGVSTGGNAPTFTSTTLQQGDVVTCQLGSSLACAVPATALSNSIAMNVTPVVIPAISITATATSICAGTNVTFTATATNPGTGATYQWKKNGGNVGTGTTTYADAGLANGDVITCELTVLTPCATSSSLTSNAVAMAVTTPVTPTILVTSSQGTTICNGTAVTFTGTITNGGTAPQYNWKKNSISVGTGSSYTTNALANNDVITCTLTSNAACVTAATVTSPAITMTVSSNVTPSISITAGSNSVCAGSAVSFTANIQNGGASPAYQWKVNGVVQGTAAGFTYTPANNDIVTCVLTSNAACATTTQATSNAVTMTVNPVLTPGISISVNPSNSICAGTTVYFSATYTNAGPAPSFDWKINGNSTGITTQNYSTSSLANGDVVTCTITGNAACNTGATATSFGITMNVTSTVTPAISITGPATACEGQNVNFSAVTTNPGNFPAYLWRVNGVQTGSNSATQVLTLTGGQAVVTCRLQSNAGCRTADTALSNAVTVNLTPGVTPSVSITASPGTSISSGQSVTFTAVPVNGGPAPSYQWTKNSIPVGGAVNTYVSNTLQNNDVIRATLHSSETCTAVNDVQSNALTITVVPTAVGAISNSFGQLQCFPNPNTGTFTVRGTMRPAAGNNKIHLAVYSTNGMQVLEQDVPVANHAFESVVVLPEPLAGGIYMLELRSGAERAAYRITCTR